jgi:hypothetical protein
VALPLELEFRVLDFVTDIDAPPELEFRVLDYVTDIALRWSWSSGCWTLLSI